MCAWHGALAERFRQDAWSTEVHRYRTEGQRQQGKGIPGKQGV